MLFPRQVWALTVKELRLILFGPFISTPIRALVFPVLFFVFLKNLFFPPTEQGIGQPRAVRPLADVLGSASGGRRQLVLVDNGHRGGEISRVISRVVAASAETGIEASVLGSDGELLEACQSASSGSSKCLAAASFYASPSEGEGGRWNYTIRADGSLKLASGVDSDANDAQVYTLPFQRVIDLAITGRDAPAAEESERVAVMETPFTTMTNDGQRRRIHEGFMDRVGKILAIAYFIAMVGIVYQLAGRVATERETGMAQLLDTMMPNERRWATRAARLSSQLVAFSIVYAPGWIAMGAVLGAMALPNTHIVVPILSHLLTGLSLAATGLFVGCCFRSSQMSGFTAVVASLILALGALVSGDAPTGTVVSLSLFFPSSNYMYLLKLIVRWESHSLAASFMGAAPDSRSTLPVIAFWVFAAVHVVVYTGLAALVEKLCWATGSDRRTIQPPGAPVAVRLRRLTKTYGPGVLERLAAMVTGWPIERCTAVERLDLDVGRGQIMVLLGANGSGKSTTLDSIAGLQGATSGSIEISYASGGGCFGHCPQKNVLWEDLTVRQNVAIFDSIKSIAGPSTPIQLDELISGCDLTSKASSKAGSLSGGQKRKLQLALMFAGGSSVCCVDEVSSGVDPLSRKRLWDILLRDAGARTMLLTTHYLDEADFLADHVAILSRGVLKASGTSLELKQRLGPGYRVRFRHDHNGAARDGLEVSTEATGSPDEQVYLTGSPQKTCRMLRQLEAEGVSEYQVDGPTLEDVFLRVAGKDDAALQSEYKETASMALQRGRKTSTPKQMRMLLWKRWTLFKRDPVLHLAAILIPVVAIACCSIVLREMSVASCAPDQAAQSPNTDASLSLANMRFVAGPGDKVSAGSIERVLGGRPGDIIMVDSLADYDRMVRTEVANLTGALFLGDENSEPAFAWRAEDSPAFGHVTQNIVDSLLYNTTIASSFAPLMTPYAGDTGSLIIFTSVAGLAMAVYPALLGLYPVLERLRGIRAMHYSNGISALPLWLAHLVFDLSVTLIVSAAAAIVFVASTSVWYNLGHLFAVFLLYGAASTMLCYVLSLFVSSQLAAFAVGAAIQAIAYFAFFVANMITFSKSTDPSSLTPTLNAIFYAVGLLCPAFSLTRAMYVSLNMFGISCEGDDLASYPGGIGVYGGPILYLCLQCVALLGVLLWKEAGYELRLPRRRPGRGGGDGGEGMELTSNPSHDDVHWSAGTSCLEAINLSKTYGKLTAVEDVSLAVPRGACLALLGPNGAGKTTCISMIRGDVAPSSRHAEILIDSVSMLRSPREARARLGVCPQIDPLDNMTVLEHLRFYASARGLPDPEHNVAALLHGLGLAPFGRRLAGQLSGGNKRKLSLGIALMGNPSVLLLDEPSSGMDALSMRLMWRVLARVTPGRALVLTTHSMEEAAALASHIAIVARRTLAQGSAGELRDLHGGGHVVHIVHDDAPHTTPEDMTAIWSWVEHTFPGARSLDGSGAHKRGQARVEIPLVAPSGVRTSLADVMESIELGKRALGIRHYSLGRATLDQVFFNVVGDHD